MMGAAMDTSFWGAAVSLTVDAYLWELFGRPLWMPGAMIEEVLTPNQEAPTRVYPRQVRLKTALEDGRIVRRDPARPYPRFGRGEAACLGLALELGCHLLINDRRPYVEAIRLDLKAVSLPEVIGILSARGMVSRQTALVWLDALRDTVSDAMIAAVTQALEGGPLV